MHIISITDGEGKRLDLIDSFMDDVRKLGVTINRWARSLPGRPTVFYVGVLMRFFENMRPHSKTECHQIEPREGEDRDEDAHRHRAMDRHSLLFSPPADLFIYSFNSDH